MEVPKHVGNHTSVTLLDVSKLSVALITVGSVFVLAFIIVAAFLSFGWLDIRWPWEDIIEQESEVAIDVVEQGPAQIIAVEPIALDCRARIEAEVPIVGTQRTTIAGATVSTDTIRMRAVGDVDTCVDARRVEVHERADGTFGVIVDADAIEFVRPRVDAIATAESVTTDRGVINQFVDIFPWTNEDDELTPAAFSFAQTVIGGSSCMQAAYDQTTAAIQAAYRDQLVEQGADPDSVEVVISGIPDFVQNEPETPQLGEFEFTADGSAACVVATP